MGGVDCLPSGNRRLSTYHIKKIYTDTILFRNYRDRLVVEAILGTNLFNSQLFVSVYMCVMNTILLVLMINSYLKKMFKLRAIVSSKYLYCPSVNSIGFVYELFLKT
ncbi:unnamed protein product [Spodoptera exigua]|nr:unnamed protein product [Spodoptera exigua]